MVSSFSVNILAVENLTACSIKALLYCHLVFVTWAVISVVTWPCSSIRVSATSRFAAMFAKPQSELKAEWKMVEHVVDCMDVAPSTPRCCQIGCWYETLFQPVVAGGYACSNCNVSWFVQCPQKNVKFQDGQLGVWDPTNAKIVLHFSLFSGTTGKCHTKTWRRRLVPHSQQCFLTRSVDYEKSEWKLVWNTFLFCVLLI